jgi:hypothetical protein
MKDTGRDCDMILEGFGLYVRRSRKLGDLVPQDPNRAKIMNLRARELWLSMVRL